MCWRWTMEGRMFAYWISIRKIINSSLNIYSSLNGLERSCSNTGHVRINLALKSAVASVYGIEYLAIIELNICKVVRPLIINVNDVYIYIKKLNNKTSWNRKREKLDTSFMRDKWFYETSSIEQFFIIWVICTYELKRFSIETHVRTSMKSQIGVIICIYSYSD